MRPEAELFETVPALLFGPVEVVGAALVLTFMFVVRSVAFSSFASDRRHSPTRNNLSAENRLVTTLMKARTVPMEHSVT